MSEVNISASKQLQFKLSKQKIPCKDCIELLSFFYFNPKKLNFNLLPEYCETILYKTKLQEF